MGRTTDFPSPLYSAHVHVIVTMRGEHNSFNLRLFNPVRRETQAPGMQAGIVTCSPPRTAHGESWDKESHIFVCCSTG